MAQIRPKPARPPSSQPPAMRCRTQRRKRRIGFNVAKLGPPLSILDEPSPTIDGTSTTENAMLFWVGWFARFHTDPEGPSFVPYEIKTLDCPILGSDGQRQMVRCVREVARTELAGVVEWLMITWKVGEVGMSIQKFVSVGEAMTAFAAPPTPSRQKQSSASDG